VFNTPIYNLTGVPEAIKLLGHRMRRLENFREPLEILKKDFFGVQRGWMDSEGRGSWQELSPGYARWKRKRVGDKPILQLTGDMYSDLVGESEGGVTIRRGELRIKAAKSGRRWVMHTHGLADGNKSGHSRPVRQVLSPALRVRKARWNRLLRDWVAGQNVR
jgi:hypothetical protein